MSTSRSGAAPPGRRSRPKVERPRRPSFRVRPGSPSDLDLLTGHRHRMWTEIGKHSERLISEHDPRYRRWLRDRLSEGSAAAFVVERRDGRPVGSGCVWLQSSHPRPGQSVPFEPYILSIFTEPDVRGQGVATRIVRACLSWSRAHGGQRVNLHASVDGRSLYRRMGFVRTWEMRYLLDPRLRSLSARGRRSLPR